MTHTSKGNPDYPNEDRSRSLERQVAVWLRSCSSKIGRAGAERSGVERSGATAALGVVIPDETA